MSAPSGLLNTSESKSKTTNVFYSSTRSKKNQVKEQALESLEKIEYLKKIIFADPTVKEYVLKEPNLLNALRDMAIKESQNKLSK